MKVQITSNISLEIKDDKLIIDNDGWITSLYCNPLSFKDSSNLVIYVMRMIRVTTGVSTGQLSQTKSLDAISQLLNIDEDSLHFTRSEYFREPIKINTNHLKENYRGDILDEPKGVLFGSQELMTLSTDNVKYARRILEDCTDVEFKATVGSSVEKDIILSIQEQDLPKLASLVMYRRKMNGEGHPFNMLLSNGTEVKYNLNQLIFYNKENVVRLYINPNYYESILDLARDIKGAIVAVTGLPDSEVSIEKIARFTSYLCSGCMQTAEKFIMKNKSYVFETLRFKSYRELIEDVPSNLLNKYTNKTLSDLDENECREVYTEIRKTYRL